jgi:threonine/homoserine/homoserine lactone efflux protein
MIAINKGVYAAETGMVAVAIIDAIYIVLAILGIGSILSTKKVKHLLKYFGSVIMIYCGLGSVLGVFGYCILPSFGFIGKNISSLNTFVMCLLLKASNPITILFWAGIFSSKIIEDGFTKKDMVLFGFGAVLATILFLGVLSFIFGTIGHSISKYETVKDVFNVFVGLVIIGFGVKLAI